jgi:hypothetical protein
MGPTALLPLRKKSCYGFLSSSKIRRSRPGLNTLTLGPMASAIATRPPRTRTVEHVLWYSFMSYVQSDIKCNVFCLNAISKNHAINASLQWNSEQHILKVIYSTVKICLCLYSEICLITLFIFLVCNACAVPLSLCGRCQLNATVTSLNCVFPVRSNHNSR